MLINLCKTDANKNNGTIQNESIQIFASFEIHIR